MLWGFEPHTHTHTHTHGPPHTHTHTYTHIHTYTYTYTYTCAHTHRDQKTPHQTRRKITPENCSTQDHFLLKPCALYVLHCPFTCGRQPRRERPPAEFSNRSSRDAAFLIATESFLLTVKLLCLRLSLRAFCIQLKLF